jgi:hypothetical protein
VVTYHLASLKGALDNLRHAEQDEDGGRKQAMLLDAKRDFQTARHNYHDRLREARTPEEFAALEECLSLAMTGLALATSELGLYDIAAADFQSHFTEWRELSRAFVQGWIDSTGHEKLLQTPTDQLPSAELVALLDFAEDTDRGWARIDQLRRSSQLQDQVHDKDSFRAPWGRKPERPVSLEPVKTATVLRQRALVLDAQCQHLKFLAARRMSARAFSQHAHEDLARAGTDALFVLSVPTQLDVR